MTIREQTLAEIAKKIRRAIKDSACDADLAETALHAFIDAASLSDWDELESMKP